MKEVLCEHCNTVTTTFKKIIIEGVSFVGHYDCMDSLIEMHKEGRYTVEDYIKTLKNR